MLASKNRLTGEQLEEVKKKGKLTQFNHFAVVIKKKDEDKPSRFGFVVSNKVSKLAIQRNRIKRAISESVRHSITNVKNGFDVIYLVKSTITKKPTDEIMRITKDSLKKMDLLK